MREDSVRGRRYDHVDPLDMRNGERGNGISAKSQDRGGDVGDPGNLPAGARLEVNDAIAKKGLLPTKVERVIQESRFGKKIEVRSEHLVVWTLSQEDVKRIDIVGDQLTQFTLVPFEQFCGLGQPSAKVATPQQQFTQQR